MAKNRNKGFALIEIIIAVAILTLLLTPIVNQLVQTLNTNRQAKQQQYAVENAQYVMEYFQNTDLEVLGDTTNTTSEVYPTAEVSPVEVTCEIYEADDTGAISSTPVDTVDYSVYRYELNSVELGSNKAEYNRTVELNDLSIQIMSKAISDGTNDYSYRIAYDLGEKPDFELASDGSLVQYTTVGTSQYVTAIVCKKIGLFADNGVANPNEVNLGNMHDLDSREVALITGNSTDYDEQAENQFYSLAMERLKEENEEWWEDELRKDTPGERLYSYGYIDGLKKLTEIKISEDSDIDGSYYQVNVNVYYENKDNDSIEYNVYSQKFYYDPSKDHECPDVYFEYQPFAVSYKLGDEVEYSQSEYITIDNTVEGARIYLYKPKWDMAYRYMNPNGSYTDESLIIASQDIYYRYSRSDDPDHTIDKDKVAIYITNANDPTDAATFKNTYIYTNLLVNTGGIDKVDVNGTGSQFYTNNTSVFSSSFKVKSGGSYTARNAYTFNENYLLGLDDEKNFEERLFSIRVYLEPVNSVSNTIVLDGAKGVD